MPAVRCRLSPLALACMAAAAAWLPAAQAAEGGGSTYSGGVENFLSGAAPPPGFHLLGYLQHYRADTLKDNAGRNAPVPPDFKVQATAAVLRGVWVTQQPLLGGQVLAEAVLPLVDLKVTAGGSSDHATGLGDLTLGAGIAWHHSPSLHSVLALDVVLPTGRYDTAEAANLGRNYLSLQPLYTLSHIDPAGFNADFKAAFTLNRTNGDTDYRSGNELFVDYAAGWGLGNGWVVGAGGYLRRQFSDDRLAGTRLDGSRARAFAIGPSVAFNNGQGWFITAKWQRESSVRNTLQGSALWVKAVVPF
jgi:hypothetical protein